MSNVIIHITDTDGNIIDKFETIATDVSTNIRLADGIKNIISDNYVVED